MSDADEDTDVTIPPDVQKQKNKDISTLDSLTTEKIISSVLETFQVIIEQIWYYRGVYPSESFEKVQAFNLVVYTNIHPGVKKYLEDTSKEILQLMKSGQLKRIFIDLYLPEVHDSISSGQKVESYAFSFTNSIFLQYLKYGGQLNISLNEGLLFSSLRSLLYSVITKLSNLTSFPKGKIPDFRVSVSVDGEDFNEMSQRDNWVLQSTDLIQSAKHTNVQNLNISQFKEVNLGFLNIKGYVGRKDTYINT